MSNHSQSKSSTCVWSVYLTSGYINLLGQALTPFCSDHPQGFTLLLRKSLQVSFPVFAIDILSEYVGILFLSG